jgi:rhodanese-related sulfurtransferase
MPVSRGQRSTRPRGRASPRPQRWPIPFVPTSLEAERNSSEGEAPASKKRHIQAGTRATYTGSSLPITREAVSSIDMTSQPDKPLSFRQVAGASFAWCGRVVTPARTKAVITHATLLQARPGGICLMAIDRLSRPCVRERRRGTVTTMNLLARWFRRSPAAPSWIEAAALVKRREQDAALLILDVRGPDEFTGPLGHIAGATNLPLNDLSERLPELVRKDRPVVVVCKTDRRSSIAADQLRKAGVADVSVLRGGMESWQELGLPDSRTEPAALSKTPSAV